MGFTIDGDRIVEIHILHDQDRVRDLDLSALDV
jgi:hypothetical protein